MPDAIDAVGTGIRVTPEIASLREAAGFGASTTAEEVLAGLDLSGRRAIITGASTGLGAETARHLAASGAELILAVRDCAAGERVAGRIEAEGRRRPQVEVLDLADLDSVRRFATRVGSRRLDLLINNAGVMGTDHARTMDGFELQFGVNHLGHFLLTLLLLPDLRAAIPARIVNLSSAAHIWADVDFGDPHCERRPYHRWLSYGQSKTANILFGVELGRRFEAEGVTAHAVMPGTIADTDLRRYADSEARKSMPAFAPVMPGLPRVAIKSLSQGVATILWAATSPDIEGRSGLYLEDCRVAAPWSEIDPRRGVKDYALDTDRAARLWTLSEKLVGVSAS